MEIWQTVPNYEDLYNVSDYGRVRRVSGNDSVGRTIPMRILKQEITNKGYNRVTLCKKSKTKRFLVHRLVATVFIRNPNNKPEVNHKNGATTSNHVENLEWCTKSENEKHAYRTGLKNVDRWKKKIAQFTLEGKLIRCWDSVTEAAKNTGILQSAISLCLTKENRKQSGGFKWKFIT